MSLNYQVNESITFPFYYTNNRGKPQRNKNLYLKLINVSDESMIFSAAPMNESQLIQGYYSFTWPTGMAVKKTIMAIVTEKSGSLYKPLASVTFTINDSVERLTNTIDLNDGQVI